MRPENCEVRVNLDGTRIGAQEQPAAQEEFNKIKLGKERDKTQGLEAITRNTSLQLA